jgi:hypothetical protein
VEQKRLAWLLQSLPIPINTWKSINMDFIMDILQNDSQFHPIFVDCRSKQKHFIPTYFEVDAPSSAKIFYREIYCLQNYHIIS